jgi:hypothetical protein
MDKVMDHAVYMRKVKRMSPESLRWVIKDCREVFKVWPNHPNGGYYADEIGYCSDELKRRLLCDE